jgi:hypothetical protein
MQYFWFFLIIVFLFARHDWLRVIGKKKEDAKVQEAVEAAIAAERERLERERLERKSEKRFRKRRAKESSATSVS